MASVLPHRPARLVAGAGLALAIAALVALVLWSILSAETAGPSGSASTPDVPHLVRMTLLQAGLTTILSLTIGTALAWALNRLDFPGKPLVVALFASAIVTPGMVVAFGLIAVWGRSGWVTSLTGLEVPIFGLGGILAAHIILDAAFAARILLARLDAIPLARLRTGQSLGLSAWRRFALIDWPALRGTMPGLASIIFLLAFTSFPIVLLLGGGPANQTLEVAIYTAVRLDFNLPGAVQLAMLQMAICSLIILAASAAAPIPSSLGPAGHQTWRDRPGPRLVQAIILLTAVTGFAMPLLAVLVDGIGPGLAPLLARPALWQALGTSLVIGSASAMLTLALALGLTTSRAASAAAGLRLGIGLPAYVYLAIPAVVLALGFFLLARRLGASPEAVAPAVVILGNSLLALPFAMATLSPPLDAIARGQGRLIRALGLSGRAQFLLVEWPLIGRDIGVVLALSFCFSLGDLGVISLFGTQDFTTLPLLMQRSLSSYRTNDAGSIAAIMLILTVLAFALLPPLFKRLADARA